MDGPKAIAGIPRSAYACPEVPYPTFSPIRLSMPSVRSPRSAPATSGWFSGKLQAGAKVTPLHAAARKGHEDICRALLASGANANARDEVGGGLGRRCGLLG